jgi:hypothetical protein
MELRIPSERIEVSEELDLLVAGGGSGFARRSSRRCPSSAA